MFYEQQGGGLGNYFFDSIFSEIDSILLFGGTHAVHFGYHRLIAARFPYAIYYRMSEGEAVVYRVLDCRRDPKWIRQQLAK
ncbi:MAG: type II toxin-antitoxin system RelE/ParE family toxin [Terrimicrobiaceae bacterium]